LSVGDDFLVDLLESTLEFIVRFCVTCFSDGLVIEPPEDALFLAGAGLIFFKGLALIVVFDDFGMR
jgi:hypothetical protein